jgi:hypothetical protein
VKHMENGNMTNFIPPPSRLDSMTLNVSDLPVEHMVTELNEFDRFAFESNIDKGVKLSPCAGVCSNLKPVVSLSESQLYWSNECFDFDVPECKVTKCISVWEKELLGDTHEEYLLNGLRNGFCIVDELDYPVSSVRRNYRSTTMANRSKVEKKVA